MAARFFLPILAAVLAVVAFSISTGSDGEKPNETPPSAVQIDEKEREPGYGRPRILGVLEDRAIDESSGLVASRTNPGLLWTHNDSGNEPFVFCVRRDATSCGTWSVAGAGSVDWEDIAAGPGPTENASYLYVGDIGDNDMQRPSVVVYRFKEPKVGKKAPADTTSTAPADVITLTYPDGPHDAESLLVHPTNGSLFIITKVSEGSSEVFRAKGSLPNGVTTVMSKVGRIRVGDGIFNSITGGDISPNGRRVAIVTYVQAFELRLPPKVRRFGRIWRQPLEEVPVAQRQQGESIAYRIDGRALLTTSEILPAPLDEVVRK